MQIMLYLHNGVGVLFIALSIPLIKRKIKINNWYGVRLPQTMKDEKVWYEVNERSGRQIFIFGTIICIISPILLCSNIFSFDVTVIVLSIIIFLGAIIILILAFINTGKVSKMK